MYFPFVAITLPLGCSIFCTRAECMFCIQIKVYLQFMQYSISFLTYMYMQFSGMCTGWKIWLHLAFIVASLKGYSTALSRVTCAPHIGNSEGLSPGSSIALGGGGGGGAGPPPPPPPPFPTTKIYRLRVASNLKVPITQLYGRSSGARQGRCGVDPFCRDVPCVLVENACV